MEVNNHVYQGRVISKSQKYPVGTNGMQKSFLYCDGDYVISGKVRTQQAKFVCFSFGENRSRIDDVFPGDVVKFNFSLSGWMKDGEKDYLGAQKCFTDALIDSKIEILDQTSRKLYNNGVDQKDDLGTFPNGTPVVLPEDNPDNDLPF